MRLRLQESGPQALQPLSVPTFFRHQVASIQEIRRHCLGGAGARQPRALEQEQEWGGPLLDMDSVP